MSIVIRRMNGDDKKALFDLLSDPLVMQFLEEPYSEKKTEQFLLSAGLSSDPLIYAVEKESEFVGYVIYHDFDENSLECCSASSLGTLRFLSKSRLFSVFRRFS